jgi:hypothetical protein
VNEPSDTTDPIADDPRVSAWLDGELDASEQIEMDDRFAADPAWSRARDQTASVRDLVRALPDVEPPAGFLESLLAIDDPAPITDLDAARRRRTRRSTGVIATLAVAAALLIAIVVPGITRTRPALATDVRVHQAGVSASGDPVSGLAPLGASMRLGR